MGQYTSRVNLYLPGGGSSGLITPDEEADIDKLNENFKKIDLALGTYFCLSTTHPATPFDGQQIYETDTHKFLIWNSSSSTWVDPSTAVPYATDGEAIAGTLTDKAVNPHGLKATVDDRLENSYRIRQTLYYTSSGTFAKATYPWLRALKVKLVGGGGAGGGVPGGGSGNAVGTGGGGGGYAESFITDITGLSSPETVTVGAGGIGANNSNGGNGGTSSFGALVAATGGEGGYKKIKDSYAVYVRPGYGGAGTAGDLQITGQGGTVGNASASLGAAGSGGSSMLGGGAAPDATGSGSGQLDGKDGGNYGGGGSGAWAAGSYGPKKGGNGAPGIVIVELYE